MAEETETGEEHGHSGPTPAQYVQVFGVLFVLTAMEVAASFIDIGPLFLPLLIGLMIIKFALVAGWFMHLRFDTRTYTAFMAGGLGLAVGLYAIVLFAFAGAVRA